MNQLAVLNKHLRLAGEANGKIKGIESRKKANEAIREFCGMGGVSVGMPAETVVLAVPEAVAGVNQGGEALPAALRDKAVEAGVSASVEVYKGNPVLEPITDHNWEVGEPGPGIMPEVEGDTHQPETDIAPEIPHVPMQNGFPVKAFVTVGSRCINPKLLAGKLEDGRQVSIERGFRNWKVGDKVECELLRSGGAPLYRQLNTRT